MQKLYCYVDESGQDTHARTHKERVFVVAVAVLEENRAELEKACEQYEHQSGKGKRKWHTGNRESKLAYWRLIVGDDRFKRVLCYSVTRPLAKPNYDAQTVLGIVKAIHWRKPDPDYTSDIYVDGISQTKQTEYANELRKVGVSVRRVHRARDESSTLIRLADALAGLAREVAENNEESKALMRQAMRRGIIAEV